MFNTQPYIDLDQLTQWNLEFDLGLKKQSVKKGEIFLKAGQRCDYLYFILTGFTRIYYLDLEGKPITHWFSGPQAMITSPFSFLKQESNILFFEALEDTELLLVSAEQLDQLIQHQPPLGESFRHINAEFAMVLSRRI
ncbi:MAG: cyclic nucleotide-binding domain-containing protein, partial [Bacteroidota bacterium]